MDINDLKAILNHKFGDGVVVGAECDDVLGFERFSSGVFALDVALGGGWPFGRCSQIYGAESTSKTTLASYACASVENHCHTCHRHRILCQCKKHIPGTALYIDQEGKYDVAWARACGMTPKMHLVARPRTAEQAVDLIQAAIEENAVDLIVLDSIAAMVPAKELEDSADSSQMGVAARLMNKFFRKVVSSLIDAKNAPSVLSINQRREKLGCVGPSTRIRWKII